MNNNEGTFTVTLYMPRYEDWLLSIDMHIMDLTGYSVYDFYDVPQEDDQANWPSDPYKAALEVLRRDMWGQRKLERLGLDDTVWY